MNGKTAQLILAFLGKRCPLCNDKFRYKVNFERHLINDHDQDEAEKYLKITTKRI